MHNRRGFTITEILIVLIIAGVMISLSVPRIRDGVLRESVRGARNVVSVQLAQARGVANHRACTSTVHVVGGNAARSWVTTCRPNGTGVDTTDLRFLSADYGVTLATNIDSIVYAPHGIAASGTWAQLVFTRDIHADSLSVSPIGRVQR